MHLEGWKELFNNVTQNLTSTLNILIIFWDITHLISFQQNPHQEDGLFSIISHLIKYWNSSWVPVFKVADGSMFYDLELLSSSIVGVWTHCMCAGAVTGLMRRDTQLWGDQSCCLISGTTAHLAYWPTASETPAATEHKRASAKCISHCTCPPAGYSASIKGSSIKGLLLSTTCTWVHAKSFRRWDLGQIKNI